MANPEALEARKWLNATYGNNPDFDTNWMKLKLPAQHSDGVLPRLFGLNWASPLFPAPLATRQWPPVLRLI